MAEQAAPFFSPQEPPPIFSAAPSDGALAERIKKLAQFAARNGPSFVDLMRTKQAGNPEYNFLNGGDGSAYWRWILYCTLYNLPPDQPLIPQAFGSQHSGVQPLHTQIAALPPEVHSGFSQVLAALTGSKESIRASKDWFMACAPHAAGMAAMMGERLPKAGSYDDQLHVIYLANDILLKGQSQRAEGATDSADPIAQAFWPVLPLMLSAVASKGGHTPEVTKRLSSIVEFWGERKVYSEAAIGELKHAIASPAPAPAPASQGFQPPYAQPGQPWAPQQQPGAGFPEAAQQPHFSGGLYGGPSQGPWQQQMPPPAYAGFPPPDTLPRPSRWGTAPGGPAWQQGPPQPFPSAAYPPPGGPAYPAMAGVPPAGLMYPPPSMPPQPVPSVPQREPYDPMSFPPGLIPSLVQEKHRTELPYSPLSPLEIEQAGLPPAQEPDAYLTSRIEKFNAELRDYRPGVTRAQLEDEQRRQRIKDGLEPDIAPQRSAAELNDGSFSRSGGRSSRDEPRAAGLGYGGGAGGGGGGSPQRSGGGGGGGREDPYSSYRKQRADAYHDLMARSQAAAVTGAPRR